MYNYNYLKTLLYARGGRVLKGQGGIEVWDKDHADQISELLNKSKERTDLSAERMKAYTNELEGLDSSADDYADKAKDLYTRHFGYADKLEELRQQGKLTSGTSWDTSTAAGARNQYLESQGYTLPDKAEGRLSGFFYNGQYIEGSEDKDNAWLTDYAYDNKLFEESEQKPTPTHVKYNGIFNPKSFSGTLSSAASGTGNGTGAGSATGGSGAGSATGGSGAGSATGAGSVTGDTTGGSGTGSATGYSLKVPKTKLAQKRYGRGLSNASTKQELNQIKENTQQAENNTALKYVDAYKTARDTKNAVKIGNAAQKANDKQKAEESKQEQLDTVMQNWANQASLGNAVSNKDKRKTLRKIRTGKYISNRFGGTLKYLNMNTPKYQDGGAVAAAQPTSPEQVQQQIVALVQAAMQGDEKAQQTIQQIMQAAQQGDQQAIQLAQMIQQVVQELQGQAQAQTQAQVARDGAKLNYIHKLRTGVNTDEQIIYQKCGGRMQKKVVKKHQPGGAVAVEDGATKTYRKTYFGQNGLRVNK